MTEWIEYTEDTLVVSNYNPQNEVLFHCKIWLWGAVIYHESRQFKKCFVIIQFTEMLLF